MRIFSDIPSIISCIRLIAAAWASGDSLLNSSPPHLLTTFEGTLESHRPIFQSRELQARSPLSFWYSPENAEPPESYPSPVLMLFPAFSASTGSCAYASIALLDISIRQKIHNIIQTFYILIRLPCSTCCFNQGISRLIQIFLRFFVAFIIPCLQ